MPGREPVELRRLGTRWEGAIPDATFSGIVSSQQPYYGYHHGPAYIPVSDYSRQTSEDQAGPYYDASALDMSMGPTSMRLVTARLLASAKDPDDPRLNVCREFYGTTNGVDVVGWDTYYGYPATSDDSHLWHVHISVLRKFCNDASAMDDILSVVTGQGAVDVTPAESQALFEIRRIADGIYAQHQPAGFVPNALSNKLNALQAYAAGSEAREKAAAVALQALGDALNRGGGNVDVTRLIAHMDEIASSERTQVEALQTHVNELLAQVHELATKRDELERRLSDAYKKPAA